MAGPSFRAAVTRPWGALLLFNLVVLPFALVGHHVGDTDTFFHLASGRWMMEHGRILNVETFSFTRTGKAWENQSWLFGYVIHLIHSLGGFPALNAVRAGLVLLTTNLMFLACWRRSTGRPLVALAVALLAFTVYAPRSLNFRPHLFSYLFLAASILLLERLRRRPGRLEPWLPVLCVVWANFHGIEYAVPLALIGAYLAGELAPRVRMPVGVFVREWSVTRWLVLLAASSAAFTLNTAGVGLFRVVGGALDTEVMSRIGEMRPFDLASALQFQVELAIPTFNHLTFLMLAIALAIPAWVRTREVTGALIVLFLAALTVQRIRFAAELAVASAGFLAGAFAESLDRARPWPRRWRLATLTLVVALVVVAAGRSAWRLWHSGLYRPLSTTLYPTGPVAFLRHHRLEGNVFNDPNMGGYLDWTLYPAVRVFMDMRTPGLFDARIAWLASGVAQAQPGMPLTLVTRQWPVNFVLVRRDWEVTRELLASQGAAYRLVYADWSFVLFVARDRLRENGEVLALRRLDPLDAELSYVERLDTETRRELGREVASLLAVWSGNTLARETEVAILLAEGLWREALARAEGLDRPGSPSPYAAYAAGVALARLGRHREAYERFSRLLAREPEFDQAYPALAETALHARQPAAARSVMERYLTRRDSLLTGTEYALLGNARYQVGAKHASVEAYERALVLTPSTHPDRPTVETNLAGAYLDLDQAARAAPLLEAALRSRPVFPEAEYNLARAWLRLGRADDARRVLTRLASDGSVPAAVRTKARERLEAW